MFTLLVVSALSESSLAAPPYTNGACIPMDVVFDVDSAIKTFTGVGDAGACCRLCTSMFGCAAFSAFARTEDQAASCALFSDMSHQVVGLTDVTSGRVIKTPTVRTTTSSRSRYSRTLSQIICQHFLSPGLFLSLCSLLQHYLDPLKGSCLPDETIRGWASTGGTGPQLQLCSKECNPKDAFPCPLDVPDGAIGSPKCGE